MYVKRLALLLEYDGANFSGSQSQRACRTVQDTLEDALFDYTGEHQRISFAGRTDSGVHARSQVAAINIKRQDPTATVRNALNYYLPQDVAIRAVGEVDSDFDPRGDAVARCYRYRIQDGRPRGPLNRRDAWQRTCMLDHDAMAEAVALLPRGPRDWAAFAGVVEEDISTTRTLFSFRVHRYGPHIIDLTLEADAFLPHQIRRTVGALERVGSLKLKPQAFAALVDAPANSVGPSAPPHGLILEAVRYELGAIDWGMVA
jgi:tRNA pseudouridine38-40 synthase